MNLQLALDRLSREECFRILHETKEYVDWIEIGTGVIKEYGMAIVKEVRSAFPSKILVADMKTCDAAAHETKQALHAGADITTVMAFSDDASIRAAIETAGHLNKRVMIDLLNVKDSRRYAELYQLGADLVSVHIGKDQQHQQTIGKETFLPLQPYPNIEVAAAGGLSAETVAALPPSLPHTIIVGSAITKADRPREAAQKIKEAMNR
ncbi:3-hexulose-6-phosphate synthase [Alteribacillus sp. HJP-4]|uniref:3-hexulose-6-phosphate synthase n=1 Tax=Alteribacillus sp. HJP-4 TaxID=2775394 RepID=UPI0035CCE6AD